MSVQQLYLLQKVDIQIWKLQEETKAINDHLSISPKVERALATVNAATKVYLELLTNQEMAQAESDALTSKMNDNEKRLYSGHVTNPKELSDISTEQDHLRQRQNSTDDDLLKTMDKVERMTVRLQEAELDLKAQTDVAKHDSVESHVRLEAIKAELATLTSQRSEAVKRVNSDELSIYEQLMSHKDHLAIAEVHVGRCSGCKIMVSSSDSRRAHEGKDLVHCSSCGRILLS